MAVTSTDRFSAQQMLTVGKTAKTILQAIHPLIPLSIAAIALFSSIRFSLKRVLIFFAVYIFVLAVPQIQLFYSNYQIIRQMMYFSDYQTVLIYEGISLLVIAVTSVFVLYFLPRLFRGIKSEIVRYGVSMILFILYQQALALISAVVYSNIDKNMIKANMGTLWTANLGQIAVEIVTMSVIYGLIWIPLYFNEHKKPAKTE